MHKHLAIAGLLDEIPLLPVYESISKNTSLAYNTLIRLKESGLTMADREKFLAELRIKRDLILHTYDSFLEKQTRLAYASALNDLRYWEEISARRKLLMLDDITVFAIAGRRLADLCKLQSAFESLRIHQITFVGPAEDAIFVHKEIDHVGFYSLLSRLIHMSYFFYNDSRRQLRLTMTVDEENFMQRHIRFIQAPLEGDKIDGFIVTKENKYGPIAVKLVDIINQSIEAAEKIMEVCSSAGIEIEIQERNG